MAPGAQPQQGGDNAYAPIWIILGIFFVLAIIGYYAGVSILRAYLHLKQVEISMLDHLLSPLLRGKLDALTSQGVIPTLFGSLSHQKVLNPALLQQISPGVSLVANTVGYYLKFPVIIFLLIFASLIFFTNTASRYARTYTMKTLLAQEKVNWPQIAPVAALDLVKVDIDQGPWAMAMNPMVFAKTHGLLKIEKVALAEGQLRTETKFIATADIGKATKVFALQLGEVWRGVEYLNPHTKALLSVFLARAHGDEEGSSALLTQMANSAAANLKKINYAGVDKLYAKHKDSKLLKRLIQQHAYVLTLMASLLQLSRTHGILAAADFLWLKPVDRPLWFMLNSVGRQTPFTEVSGPFAHWLSEKKMARRLMVPNVLEAAKALDLGVRDIIYHPEEE